MPWRKFLIFNFLGAAAWVIVISSLGYLFGRQWEHLERNVQRFDRVAAIVLVIVLVLVWWRNHRRGSAESSE
jgi:membrane protein DedA with SNARE-associated domain